MCADSEPLSAGPDSNKVKSCSKSSLATLPWLMGVCLTKYSTSLMICMESTGNMSFHMVFHVCWYDAT